MKFDIFIKKNYFYENFFTLDIILNTKHYFNSISVGSFLEPKYMFELNQFVYLTMFALFQLLYQNDIILKHDLRLKLT